MTGTEAQLHSGAVRDILVGKDFALRSGVTNAQSVRLGFTPLDGHLGGGLAAGDLALLAGSQGVGKTTFALQAARNVAMTGTCVTFVSFEHDGQALVEKLLVLEANLLAGKSAPTLEETRHRLSAGSGGLADRLSDLPGMAEALAAVEQYGASLHLISARGDATGLQQIRDAIAWHQEPGLLVVDYLQKVMMPDMADEDRRVSRIGTALKDLALDTGTAVLAVTAVDRVGLDSQRIRARHLKGSVTLAYEADVILVLQNKYDLVARNALVYDLNGAQEHHRWIICSIEKNRHGEDRVEISFRKQLSRSHLDAHGRIEQDRLVDERMQVGVEGT